MRIKVVYDFVWTYRVKKNMKSELDSIRERDEYNSFVRKKYLRLIFSEKVPEAERYRNRGDFISLHCGHIRSCIGCLQMVVCLCLQ